MIITAHIHQMVLRLWLYEASYHGHNGGLLKLMMAIVINKTINEYTKSLFCSGALTLAQWCMYKVKELFHINLRYILTLAQWCVYIVKALFHINL